MGFKKVIAALKQIPAFAGMTVGITDATAGTVKIEDRHSAPRRGII